jgi:hypothetical protein
MGSELNEKKRKQSENMMAEKLEIIKGINKEKEE